MTKYLCVCHYGHSRSVCCARVLHSHNKVAVAIGYATSGDAIQELGRWADYVIVMDSSFVQRVPTEFVSKTVICHVGPDRWSNPYSQELHKIIEEKLKALGHI